MAVIEVENLTKEYRLGQLKGLKQSAFNALSRVMGKPVEKKPPFKALDGISFKVESGEVVGIIGTNGAGKSTLLKMLARISTPTRGSVKVSGTVAPLIEVGAGLVGDLTGRENIFLNGSILGLSRQTVRKKFDEIVAFAELEEFIDTPIKRYSSGMAVRLGFSIATSVDADILIVDEVLAVGDLAFQRKCFDRMEEMIKRQGKTVLLVSHNIRQVERLCSRVILIDNGKILKDGDTKIACELFYDRSNTKIAKQISHAQQASRYIRKTGEIDMEYLILIDRNGKPTTELVMGEPVTIRGVFNSTRGIEKPEVVYGFHTTDFLYISSMGTAHIQGHPDIVVGKNIIDCHIQNLPLVSGVYCLRVGVLDKFRREIFYAEMLSIFTVKVQNEQVTKMPVLGFVHIPAQWSFEFEPK